ncbi:MAG: glycerol-3-phosphate dehydrogenase/oxidase [Actinomycetaceae bacterium]|nr:glycerol-3-phosphate dehydrogenase/oxidase [Actinomycetaceae bacterium]
MASDEGLDILVVGGGVTGAGIAYDAALRGLRVGIIDAQDWSAGTSSRSSKLVHGGLRYLYQLDFPLVHEALTERGLLLDYIAPHLVKKMPLLWPFKQHVIERAYSTVGVGLYDAMAQIAHRGSVPIQKHYTRKGALDLVPDLRKDSLIGAMVYYDARVDDSRLVLTLIRSAVEYGAMAASRVQMVGMATDATGRVVGAEIEDLETGKRHHIRTRTIINATGVWTEETQALSGENSGLKVLASKGIHIVVPKERIQGSTGLFIRTEKSVLFIIPWKRYWIIGTTDTTYTEDFRHPVANKDDIDYILDHANSVLETNLTHNDIIGTYAGLRPLLMPGTKGTTAKSTKVSREHTVTEAAPGLIVIAGGKLTTYRVMAEDAVDFAIGRRAKTLPSLTKTSPLRGARGYKALWNARRRMAKESGLSLEHIEDLLDRYGSDIREILRMIKKDPDLGKELKEAPEYLRAEIAFGVKYEGAIHLEDTMCHRTRLTYERRNHGLDAAPECADIMASLLGWDSATRTAEIEAYTKRCHAEDEAANIANEKSSQKARGRIGDVTPMHNLHS